MLSTGALKFAVDLLEEHRIHYYVFGGFALDGLRGAITRQHADLDIYVLEDDLQKFCKVMESAGYPCIKRENMYFIDKEPLKIGIVVLSKDTENYVSRGNKTLAFYPKPIFSKVAHGRIKDITFRVAPNEVLAFEAQHSRFSKDKNFGTTLPCNTQSFSSIQSHTLRASRKNREGF
jgi:hypothetical protein